ncbi:prepilin peptidase [Patescibacteria group bacterium]|nr:prepilin peptidase [Patescibacteria group bacterium]
MFNIIVFIFGLFIGSFLNCVVYRIESKKSFLKGRSFCPHCKHTLSWLDLIPIFSYLFLEGRCRYCSKKISVQYPLVELLTGALFSLILWNFGLSLAFGFWVLVSSLLIILFIYDLKHFIIPDRVIYPAILLTLVFRIWNFVGNWELGIGYFGATIGAAGFFLTIFLISRGKWLGFGDVKLAILIGLLLGFPNILVSLFSAFLIGAIIGVGLIFLKKKTLKSEVPFGPFLILGIYIALFFGDQIVKWYLNILI